MKYKFIVVTEKEISYHVLLDEKSRLVELHPMRRDSLSFVGNIYIGRVSNIVKGIHAAFVDIGTEQDVFMQLEETQSTIFTTKKDSASSPRIGDELLIQITKEAYMGKAPTGTCMITIPGRYSILTYQKNFIGISSKIKDLDERKRLNDIFKPLITSQYGFIIRTNAQDVSDEDLITERDLLIQEFQTLITHYQYKTCFQCVYQQPEPLIQLIRDLPHAQIEQYIFNDEQTFLKAKVYFDNPYFDNLISRFQLYTDNSYSLFKLYGLHSKIEKARTERVWLDSGANLMIQPTEALTVIDVNSSKSTSKKGFEETIYKINIEAAKEIVRQIRLRNLSGIIIVDFIDMQNTEHIKALMNLLSGLFALDRIKTTLVDMTPLGLVEITRKKIGQSIYERFKALEK